MDEREQLRSIVRWRTKHKPDSAARLADALSELMENRISPRHTRFGSVVELWGGLLPAELAQHCKLADISSGQLKVQVDSPSYMHELRLCSSELLSEIQRQCPKARIEKIKFVIG